jgi:uncharacterized protein
MRFVAPRAANTNLPPLGHCVCVLLGQAGLEFAAEDLVTKLVEKHLAALSDLCRRYGVERLYLFGSAVSGRLQPTSDLDFFVEMADRQPNAAYARRYLEFADELERLFSRRVDLVTEQAIRNPYLRREIEATRQLIYGQSREEAAV